MSCFRNEKAGEDTQAPDGAIPKPVHVGEVYGPILLIADESYVRTACFFLNDYRPEYMASANSRLVPSHAIARDLQQLFLHHHDSNTLVGLHQSEEIEFFQPVLFGSKLSLRGRCIDKFMRRGKEYYVIEASAYDENNNLIVRQRQTELLSIPDGAFDSPSIKGSNFVSGISPSIPANNRRYVDSFHKEILIGDHINPQSWVCDQNQISVFSGAGLFRHNTHTDDIVARKAGFRTCVVQGMMVTCWACNMMYELFGISWLYSGRIKTKYLKPMLSGDFITIGGRFLEVQTHFYSVELWSVNSSNVLTSVSWVSVNKTN